MPHFYCKDKKILITTNFKVMSSSLRYFSNHVCTHCIELEKLFPLGILIQLENWLPFFIKKNYVCFLEHYLLVRNPYEKIVSFYKDKFLKLYSSDSELQSSQKILLPYLGIDEKIDSKTQIKDKLINTSFDDFIYMLPKIYNADLHLTPQHWVMYPLLFKTTATTKNQNQPIIQPRKIKRLSFRHIKILKIENTAEMKIFSAKINFDINIKKYHTQEIKDPNISSDSIKIINQIYAKDFEIFGYPKI